MDELNTDQEEFLHNLNQAFQCGAPALRLWGSQPQVIKCMEEMGELIQVLCKSCAGTLPNICVADEIADVLITTLQMARLYGVSNVNKRLVFKMDRLNQRIQLGYSSDNSQGDD